MKYNWQHDVQELGQIKTKHVTHLGVILDWEPDGLQDTLSHNSFHLKQPILDIPSRIESLWEGHTLSVHTVHGSDLEIFLESELKKVLLSI